MTTALNLLFRLALVCSLLFVAISVQPMSAQSLPYCECPTSSYCKQTRGRGWLCYPTGCIIQGSKTGLCKKVCTVDSDAVCPSIYDPVICDDGEIYSNQCLADADCATGCSPNNEQ